MKNWKMTKKDEVSFYFCMMISMAVILMTTVTISMHWGFRIAMMFGFLSNLYLYCKASKELKEEEAQKKAEEDAKKESVT